MAAESVCRGCVKLVTNTSKIKNIFKDDFTWEFGKKVKINIGMESITGQKVIKANDLPENICEDCFNKLEVCLNFRKQLQNSLNVLYKNSLDPETISTLNVKNNQVSVKKVRIDEYPDSTFILSDDTINVDGNSTSDDEISEDEGIIRSCREEQDDSYVIVSDSPSTDINTYSSTDNLVKVINNDIESDIDVCSGEDDEILELDINCAKNEPTEVNDSSGSDIDVCDYEPSGKRTKNYNTLSPPVQF